MTSYIQSPLLALQRVLRRVATEAARRYTLQPGREQATVAPHFAMARLIEFDGLRTDFRRPHVIAWTKSPQDDGVCGEFAA